MRGCLALGMLAGCGPERASEAHTGAPAEDTVAMSWSTEEPAPLLDAEAVAAALEAVVALGAPSGYDIAMAWLAHLDSGDPACPGDEAFMEFPAEGCTASSGAYFSGIGWYEVTEAEVGAEGELVELSFYHGGDFAILDPEGARFAGGGELRSSTTTEGATRTVALHMEGSWVEEGREGWLGAGFSAVYEGEVLLAPGELSVTITGGLGVGEADLFLDGLAWSSAGDCAGQLRGALGLRDARGYWTRWELGERCDGCGALTFHDDQDLGELCLDLSAWGEELALKNAPR